MAAVTVRPSLGSPLLRESPMRDLGAVRKKRDAEPACVRKGAKVPTRCRARRCLDRTVAELVQFLLLNDKSEESLHTLGDGEMRHRGSSQGPQSVCVCL